jgi:hypothetical protein
MAEEGEQTVPERVQKSGQEFWNSGKGVLEPLATIVIPTMVNAITNKIVAIMRTAV